MRTVKVFSTQANDRQEFSTDVSTWGELKNVIGGMYQNGMKGQISQTKQTLEHDAAQLPEGDFTLFLVPTKVKSGRIL